MITQSIDLKDIFNLMSKYNMRNIFDYQNTNSWDIISTKIGKQECEFKLRYTYQDIRSQPYKDIYHILYTLPDNESVVREEDWESVKEHFEYWMVQIYRSIEL